MGLTLPIMVGLLVLIRTFVSPGTSVLAAVVIGGFLGFALARGRNLLLMWFRKRDDAHGR